MGGFAVESSEFISGQDYLYLTTRGVRRVIELGYPLPDLCKEAIFDKSKADSLGKILVCLQAGYMIFQVTGRLVARLPITLLEVNTLGHVLCALTMYAFWFQKPLGVTDPVVLSEDWAKSLFCLWFMKDDQRRDMQDLSSQLNEVESYRELDLLMLFAHPDRREQVKQFRTIDRPTYGYEPISVLLARLELESELPPYIGRNEHRAHLKEARESADVYFGLNTCAPAASILAYAMIQRDLPEDLENIAHHCILFYKHSDPSQVSGEDDILQRLGSSKLWDGLTHVYHCDQQDQMEAWWECWSRQAAPVVNCWDRTNHSLNRKPVSLFKTYGVSAFIPHHVFLDSAGLRRWELAHRGLELDLDWPTLISRPNRDMAFVIRRVENWPHQQDWFGSKLGSTGLDYGCCDYSVRCTPRPMLAFAFSICCRKDALASVINCYCCRTCDTIRHCLWH
jgi:hypothetical protein